MLKRLETLLETLNTIFFAKIEKIIFFMNSKFLKVFFWYFGPKKWSFSKSEFAGKLLRL